MAGEPAEIAWLLPRASDAARPPLRRWFGLLGARERLRIGSVGQAGSWPDSRHAKRTGRGLGSRRPDLARRWRPGKRAPNLAPILRGGHWKEKSDGLKFA